MNPVEDMRGPPRATPRRHLTPAELGQLLATAQRRIDQARRALTERPDSRRCLQRLFTTEQELLLVRLVADTGARRGELATLRRRDLDGRVLTIERNLSNEELATPKSGQTRRITIGATTLAMIDEHLDEWATRLGADQIEDDWLFARDPHWREHARADHLSKRFRDLRDAARLPDAKLHRVRHSVATQLVADGQLLAAQGRLGHRDPSTTLRHYSHATPLDDQDIADDIDARLNNLTQLATWGH